MNICMIRPHLDDLPPIRLPDGYELLTAADMDDPAQPWADVVNSSFGDTRWTAESVRRDFISQPQYDPQGVFFVAHQGRLVATAFAWRDDPQETRTGRIHFVGTVPDQRGRGLGRAVVLAVLHYLCQRGFHQGLLETQAFRLPAIRIYLALGFEPVPRNEEEEREWAPVMAQLRPGGSS